MTPEREETAPDDEVKSDHERIERLELQVGRMSALLSGVGATIVASLTKVGVPPG